VRNMLKLGLILAIYATVACVGLAFVYAGTKTVIAERQKTDLATALKDLFPSADDFKEIVDGVTSPDPTVSFNNIYMVTANGTTVGIAVRAVGKSYGGPITILAGVDTQRKITGVKILENKDTPGLGANAASPAYFVDRAAGTTFYGQFDGKSIDDRFEVKGDVTAITASTITSKAVSGVVKAIGKAAGDRLAAEGGK